MKLCKDCKHFVWGDGRSATPLCKHEGVPVDPIYGGAAMCPSELRADVYRCGPNALWFVRKPTVEELQTANCKACSNCKLFEPWKGSVMGRCTHKYEHEKRYPTLLSPYGMDEICAHERRDEGGRCGPDALLFEEKETEPPPPVPEHAPAPVIETTAAWWQFWRWL